MANVIRSGGFDFDRLERVVAALVEAQQKLRAENEALRRDLSERESRVKVLDAQILELNQRRTDAIKRLDDLVSHIDDFETRVARSSGGGE